MPAKEPIKISNSEIEAFCDCPRKWWYTYYRGLTPKEEKTVGPLPLGSRLHAALEIYYRSFLDGSPVDILKAHSDLIEADRLKMMLDGGYPSDLDKEAELGRIMLEGYVRWVDEEGLDANLEIVGIESRLEYPILPGRVILTGKVDLLAKDRRNGTNEIIDFKTAASFNHLLNVAAMSPQLMTYQALQLAMDPDKHDELSAGSYRMLRKVKRTASAKPPFYLSHTVRHSREMMRNHWDNTREKVTRIADARDRLDAGENFQSVTPPNVSSTCDWKCAMIHLCPISSEDEAMAEEFMKDNFRVQDPRAYLDNDPLVDHIKNSGLQENNKSSTVLPTTELEE